MIEAYTFLSDRSANRHREGGGGGGGGVWRSAVRRWGGGHVVFTPRRLGKLLGTPVECECTDDFSRARR